MRQLEPVIRCCLLALAWITCFANQTSCLAQPADTFGARWDEDRNATLPNCEAVIDVSKPPYNAKRNGINDDTDAIQAAISDIMGLHRVLYFPEGTYLISRTLVWSKKNSSGREAWGKNYFLGQNCNKTIIKLKDGVFSDPKNPQSMMWCGGFGSADWFHNYVENICFDVGENNAGAIALQFYSNNYGAVRSCRFLALDESGSIGIDLAHRDMNGPLLIQDCEVQGFEKGIRCGGAVNGQTFERITLKDQRKLGFENEGQSISIRSLWSHNKVPAIQTYGVLCLIDSNLQGHDEAANAPAIVNFNNGKIHVRDTMTGGYSRAVADIVSPDSYSAWRVQGSDKRGSLGPNVTDYSSHAASSPFGTLTSPTRLPVKEPPTIADEPISRWANVNDFGADPTGQLDSSKAIQKAIDSGVRTIFFPGFYSLEKPLRVRGNAQRLLGVGAWIDYNRRSVPNIIIEDGNARFVTIEHFDHIGGGIKIDTQRDVFLKSLGPKKIECKRVGDLFLEDITTDDLVLKPDQSLWARQLNVENEGTHVTNQAGKLWVLGYKTERGGTLLKTIDGGTSEIYGGFSYTTTAGKLAPMFVTVDSTVFAFFSEVCYSGDPFAMLVQETRNGITKTIAKDQSATTPYIAEPNPNN